MGMELSPTTPALAPSAGPSSSSTAASTNGAAEGARQRALALQEQKESLQSEMDLHFSTLRSNSSTMNTPLLTPDGFPRDDIDVFAVRTARVRVIELRNDLLKVEEEMKLALEGVWKPVLEERERRRGEGMDVDQEEQGQGAGGADGVPFAKVDGVMPQSPAGQAEMQRDDLILVFGPLSTVSHPALARDMSPLAGVVQQYQNKDMQVVVLRGGDRKTLVLRPRTGWGGRGMLGCHIVPYRP